MKNITIIILAIILLAGSISAQSTTVVSEASASDVGLDLNAVAEVFKDSDDLAEFEKNLNDADNGINNLDLDENGEIDYLRVMENSAEDTRLIIVQAALGENQYQDVATIAVEKEAKNYNMQVHGSPVIYGANYYVVPRYRTFSGWRLVNWLFRPNYRPYRSVFGWRVYPSYWRVRRPVTYNVYRTRVVKFGGRKNFARSKTVRVKTVTKVKYKQQNSTLVKKKKVVKKKKGNNTVVKKKGVKTQTKTNANGKTVTRKKGVVVKKNNKTGKKTVVKGKKKTVKTKKGKKTKTKKVKKTKKRN